MATSSAPLVQDFTYCFVPCDKEKPVEQTLFTGKDDKELRETINKHFAKGLFTSGQRQEFKEDMQRQIKENAEKQKQQGSGGPSDNPMANAEITEQVLDQAMGRGGSFEIVPISYPDATNGYKGLSLYIDQVGRFKDLPLNDRASKLCQRDIRGDAFVIASYDDPIKDDWARISCTKEQIEGLLINPPEKCLDPQAKAAAMQASMQTTEVKAENMAKALALKEAGNAFIKKGTFDSAEEKYTEGLKELTGRVDSIDMSEYNPLKVALHLNRAQARMKQSKCKDAEGDCTEALAVDGSSVKAYFKRASARRQMGYYETALEDLAAAAKLSPSDPEITKLIEQVQNDAKKAKAAEKAKYSKLFSS